MSGSTPGKRVGLSAAPWALWLLGLLSAFHPTLRTGLRDFQIYVGDPRLIQYLFEHSFRWIRGDPLHASLWSLPVFHPALGVGAFTDTILGTAPLYWIPRAGGLDVDVSFQLWMMCCLSLDFAAAYWLLSRPLHTSPWAAALGAFVFGFGSTRLANFNSPQLLVLFYGVFALHALVRACEPDRDRRSAALWLHASAALLALQIWSSWYPSFFLIFVLILTGLGALCFQDTRTRMLRCLVRNGAAFVSAGLLGALAIVPMVQAHLTAVIETGWRPYSTVETFLPDWSSWLYTGWTSVAYGWLDGLGPFTFGTPVPPHANGVGFVTLGVALAGLWRARHGAAARLVLITTVLVVLASTRLPGDGSAWTIVYAWVPGARSIRYVARIGMYLSLAAAIGVASFFDGWRVCRRADLGIALLLAGVCLGEQLHALGVRPTRTYRAAVLEIATEVDPTCGAFFLEVEHPDLPRGEGVWHQHKNSQVAAMWISLESAVPTVNGILGSWPRGWELWQVDVHDAATHDALEEALRVWLAARAVAPEQVCRLRIPARRMPATALWRPSERSEPAPWARR